MSSEDRLHISSARSISTLAVQLFLEGRVEEAATLFERILDSVLAALPSARRYICDRLADHLREKHGIEVKDCSKLREEIEKTVRDRLPEEVIVENLTPAELEAAVRRRTAAIIAELGFIAAMILGHI